MFVEFKKRVQQKCGFSLVEVMFALGIVSVGAVGVTRTAKHMNHLRDVTFYNDALDNLEARLVSSFGNRDYAYFSIKSHGGKLWNCLQWEDSCSYSETFEMPYLVVDSVFEDSSFSISGAGTKYGLNGKVCPSSCKDYWHVKTYLGKGCTLNHGPKEPCKRKSGNILVAYSIYLKRDGTSSKKVRSGMTFTLDRRPLKIRKGEIKCDPGDIAVGWGNFAGEICSPPSEWIYENPETLAPGGSYTWDLTQCADDEFVAGIDTNNKVVCRNLAELD